MSSIDTADSVHRIFISYSRFDREKVMKMVRLIEQETGMKCWVDMTGIESGGQIEDTIVKALDQAEVLLFMMSDQSLASPWTKREVLYAESEGKRIVPVSLDGKPLRDWVKFHFGQHYYIDATSKEQVDKLLSNLTTWLADPSGSGSAVTPATSPRKKRKWIVPAAVAVLALSVLWKLVISIPASKGPETENPVPGAVSTESSARSSGNRGTLSGHDWVDLGTGVKWATCNVGASFPGDYGRHFAWGETEAKPDYSWENYRFRSSGNSPETVRFLKYNSSDGIVCLDRADDVATLFWGEDWRMPTKEEVEALVSGCSISWTSRNGHDGCLFTSRSNGEEVFFPASGYQMDDSSSYSGIYGHYWTSSLNERNPEIAWYLFLDKDEARLGDRYRYVGRAVRAVKP